MNPMSDKRRQQIPLKRQSYNEASRRARGRCEVCGGVECGPLQQHHLFGREGKIAPPLSLFAELTILCGLHCHMALHANRLAARQEELRWRSVGYMLAKTGIVAPFRLEDPQWTALRAMSFIERVTQGGTLMVRQDPEPQPEEPKPEEPAE